MHNLSRINIFKSLYYTYKFKGCCIVGKSYIYNTGGVKFANKNSVFIIGINGTTTVGSQLLNEGTIIINGYVSIYKGTKIVVSKNSTLSIGDGTYINEYSRIFCRKEIKIGSRCAIGFNVDIMDSDLHSIYSEKLQINKNESISIADKVWVCAHSTICKGSKVERNVIVGSNSRVSGNLGSNYIYAGNPLKKIRQFDSWQ